MESSRGQGDGSVDKTERLPQKREDLRLDPQHPHIQSQMEQLIPTTPSPERQSWDNPWGLTKSVSSRFRERLYLEK